MELAKDLRIDFGPRTVEQVKRRTSAAVAITRLLSIAAAEPKKGDPFGKLRTTLERFIRVIRTHAIQMPNGGHKIPTIEAGRAISVAWNAVNSAIPPYHQDDAGNLHTPGGIDVGLFADISARLAQLGSVERWNEWSSSDPNTRSMAFERFRVGDVISAEDFGGMQSLMNVIASTWLVRPFDPECSDCQQLDPAVVEAVRKVVPDWDGERWSTVSAALRHSGASEAEIRKMTVDDIRQWFAVGQHKMTAVLGGLPYTTEGRVSVISAVAPVNVPPSSSERKSIAPNSASEKPKPVGHVDDAIVLTASEIAVLKVLAESPHEAMFHIDIQKAAGYSKKPTREAIERLRKLDFVAKTPGKQRKGEAITSKGKSFFEKLRNSASNADRADP